MTAQATFNRRSSGAVKLSARASEVFHRYVQRRPGDTEAGGIMLGRLILNSDDIVIDEATEPQVEDRRSRFFFWRSNKPAQRRVQQAWSESEGTQVYLGEWHTHPEDIPSPSAVDIDNWKTILRKSRYEQGFLFFAIVGRRAIRIWEGRILDGVRIEELSLKVDHE